MGSSAGAVFGRLLVEPLRRGVPSLWPSSPLYHSYSPEPAQPLNKEPKWVTAEEAVQCIKSCDSVFVTGCGTSPIGLVGPMTEHGKKNKLEGVTVCHLFPTGDVPYIAKDCEGIFRACTYFISGSDRKALEEGRVDVTPIFLSDLPKLFTKKIVKPDVSLVHVSPPDIHGFCSLGISVDYVRAAMIHSKKIIAQVNKYMPRTFGDALVHQSHFDFAVRCDVPLPSYGGQKPNEAEKKIGSLIAENLIEDGATLQIGIGSIPDAVLGKLGNHKDLGIHSEMISSGVSELVKSGALTGHRKILDQGKIIATFLMGSQEFYCFCNDNPLLEMKVVDYTNSTNIISQQPMMTAINSAIEIDLTGQACADSIGARMYSGFGGQVDFIRGAAEGFDGKGKPIIAFQSTNPRTKESKISPMLKPGAGVVTSRAHVHYVVTENGIASLFGKNLRQRAHELIKVAHPDHRQALEKAAFERLKVMPSS